MTNCERDMIYHPQEAQHLTQKQMEGVRDTVCQHPSHARRIISPNIDVDVCVIVAKLPSSLNNRREHSAKAKDCCDILQHIDISLQWLSSVITMSAQLWEVERIPSDVRREETHAVTMARASIHVEHTRRCCCLQGHPRVCLLCHV
jgi:hypothetical protein